MKAEMVEVFVFRRSGGGVEFLLVERADGDYLGGTWHPVGGMMEGVESAAGAAVRELREETGLSALRLWQVDTAHLYFVASLDRVIVSVAFVAEVPAEAAVTLSSEHQAVRWEPADVVQRALLWPGQRRLFAEVRAEILSGGAAEPWLRIPL